MSARTPGPSAPFDPLSYPERMRELARRALAAAADGTLPRVLDGLADGDGYRRHLALSTAIVARHEGHLRRARADPDPTVRRHALSATAVALVDDDSLAALLVDAPRPPPSRRGCWTCWSATAGPPGCPAGSTGSSGCCWTPTRLPLLRDLLRSTAPSRRAARYAAVTAEIDTGLLRVLDVLPRELRVREARRMLALPTVRDDKQAVLGLTAHLPLAEAGEWLGPRPPAAPRPTTGHAGTSCSSPARPAPGTRPSWPPRPRVSTRPRHANQDLPPRREPVTHIDFSTPPTLPAPNGYSHVAGIPAGSRLVWTSGQVPIGADGTVAPAGDWEAQARLVMQNVGTALEAGGATWDDVFKLTIFVVDTSALAVVRSVRDEFVNVDRPPTSTLVQVAGLFRPDLLLEIEAVAAVAHG